MFNALKYTRNLEEKGFDRDQAEILVRMFMQMIEFNMVSKTDFEGLKLDFEKFQAFVHIQFERIENRFKRVEQRLDKVEERLDKIEERLDRIENKLDQKFSEMEARFDQKLLDMETRLDQKLKQFSLQLTVKLGMMLALSVGLLSTILAIKL